MSLERLQPFTIGSKILRVDYHLHSNFSDGENTIEDYIVKAKESGLLKIAITDHVWRTSTWIDEYIKEINRLRDKYSQIKILIGVEAKALNRDGKIDVTEETIKKVDFVMGVCHANLPLEKPPYNKINKLSANEATKVEADVILGLINNKNVGVIGHLARTYYKFFYKAGKIRRQYPEELFLKIIKHAKKKDKILEYNPSVPFSDSFLQLLLRENCKFSIGSDSHSIQELGKIDYNRIKEVMRNF